MGVLFLEGSARAKKCPDMNSLRSSAWNNWEVDQPREKKCAPILEYGSALVSMPLDCLEASADFYLREVMGWLDVSRCPEVKGLRSKTLELVQKLVAERAASCATSMDAQAEDDCAWLSSANKLFYLDELGLNASYWCGVKNSRVRFNAWYEQHFNGCSLDPACPNFEVLRGQILRRIWQAGFKIQADTCLVVREYGRALLHPCARPSLSDFLEVLEWLRDGRCEGVEGLKFRSLREARGRIVGEDGLDVGCRVEKSEDSCAFIVRMKTFFSWHQLGLAEHYWCLVPSMRQAECLR